MTMGVYLASAAIVLAMSAVVFTVIVPRSYRHWGRLTPAASASQYSAFLAWVAFGSWNVTPGWPSVEVGAVQEATGWVLFLGGWAITLWALVGLGLRRSHGLWVSGLRQTGLYGLSRNPQATAFLVAMIGYLLLWPTWRNVGVVGLVAVLVHLMIRAEEKHLLAVFGEEYERYRGRVPRYLGIPRR